MKLMVMLLAAMFGVSASALAQTADPELQKVIDQYQQAFNKGDAKAIAALYTTDALRLSNGELLSGREAIQKDYEAAFAGPLKGATLTIRPGRTMTISQDVRIQEGIGEVSGTPSGPGRSRYLNTFVRQGGQWRAASVTVAADPGEATKP